LVSLDLREILGPVVQAVAVDVLQLAGIATVQHFPNDSVDAVGFAPDHATEIASACANGSDRVSGFGGVTATGWRVAPRERSGLVIQGEPVVEDLHVWKPI
jgi:hypothetical protein